MKLLTKTNLQPGSLNRFIRSSDTNDARPALLSVKVQILGQYSVST